MMNTQRVTTARTDSADKLPSFGNPLTTTIRQPEKRFNGSAPDHTCQERPENPADIEHHDHERDDEENNRLQTIVLLQFLNGDPTAIASGTLRHIK
jgi:hypothetical protein